MKEMLKLVFPIVLTFLGMNLMGIVDLLFVGRIDAAAIGAVGLGNSLYAWFFVFGIGLCSGMEFLVAHSHGAQEHEKQDEYLSQGLLLSTVAAVVFTGALVWIALNLGKLGVNPEVLGPAMRYTAIFAFSLFPSYVFNVFRLYLTAKGIARPAMMMLVVGNVLNIILDFVFVLGNWGMPSFGAEGAGWATLISRTVMMAGLGWVVVSFDSKNSNGNLNWNRLKFRYKAPYLKKLMRLGLPSALQLTFEVGVFAISTTLAARLTAYELAAHQVVLNIASTTFMVPLGVGSATAVLVGQAMGRKDFVHAKETGWRGFKLGVGFMVLSCLVFLIFPQPVLHAFTAEEKILAVSQEILFIAALFQLSDGVQAVGTGALRGLGDTHSAMFLNLGGHWALGLPMGIFLCFQRGWGLKGMWVGLSLGLTVVAVGVMVRWWYRAKGLAGGSSESLRLSENEYQLLK